MAVYARRAPEPVESDWIVIRFLRETIDELRKVVWPTPAELYRYTMVVIVTTLVIAMFIGLVDWGVSELVRRYVYAAVGKATGR
jgi:preprotein translocase subunit SecE